MAFYLQRPLASNIEHLRHWLSEKSMDVRKYNKL